MIKDKRIAFAVYVIAFIAFWNIAEMLWMTLTGGTGRSNTEFDILTPLIVGIVTGYLFFIAKSVNINDELKEAKKTKDAVIIDVRSSDEYAQGHIPGALNVPADNIEAMPDVIPNRETPIFTYCLRGSRSSRASRTLKAMGYTRVINMGGINKYKGERER